MLSCLQILAVGGRFDGIDEVVYISNQTVPLYFESFYEDIVDMYGEIYMSDGL